MHLFIFLVEKLVDNCHGMAVYSITCQIIWTEEKKKWQKTCNEVKGPGHRVTEWAVGKIMSEIEN